MLLALSSVAHTTAQAAPAGEAPAAASIGEVIVTARKREESVMRAPVVMSVISPQELAAAHVQHMDDLVNVMPSIKVQRGVGGTVGTAINLRGIGSGVSVSFADQSVGFAVDQVGFAHGSAYDAAVFDVSQVEVLRGPQGLFFGKSTTAGLISFTTGDPTPTWQASATGGYEFNANERFANGYVAGPLTDRFGIRVAGFYTKMDGYLYNPNPAGAPNQRRVPDGDNYGGRVTLKYDDGEKLLARLKVGATGSYSHGEQEAIRQMFSCPLGHAQFPFFQYDNCKLDKYALGETPLPPYNPSVDWAHSLGNTALFTQFSPFKSGENGTGFIRKRGISSSLLLEYKLPAKLKLTSVSGYLFVHNLAGQQGVITSQGIYQIPNEWTENTLSQELRLTSQWDGWINFMAGGLYVPRRLKSHVGAVIPSRTTYSEVWMYGHNNTSSAFAQLLLTPMERWEFTAGVRHTRIKQDFDYLSVLTNTVGFRPGDANNAAINQAPLVPDSLKRLVETNTSPEFTLAYRPTGSLMYYASYKWGYKGPGSNGASFGATSFLSPGAIIPFGGEKVKGAEGGIKATLLDGQANLTLALYDYKYLGLQVSHYDANRARAITSNGADAVTRGVEVGLAYHPVEAVQLNGFVAYNDGHYTDFTTSPCYGGQTAALGCLPTATPGITQQNLSGRRLSFAPKWTGNFDVTYTQQVWNEHVLTLRGGVNASSSYNVVASLHPGAVQKAWAVYDASVTLADRDGRWELGLIGRNLTNKLYVVTGFDAGLVTPGVISDVQGIANRSRQILLQLTVRPDLL